MPVPSSYNDITQDSALRDHIGWVWYDREFFVAKSWSQSNVFVRFGSASYHAIVVSRLRSSSITLRLLYHQKFRQDV